MHLPVTIMASKYYSVQQSDIMPWKYMKIA